MSEYLTLHEIVSAARQNLSQGVWDYLTGGAETETTLRRNRMGLDSIAFRPRVLNDVTEIDCTATVLGHKTRLPVVLAPMGSLDSMHPDGSVAVARAAKEFGVISYLSSVTKPGLEEVAAAADHPKIYQLYVRGDRDWVADYVKRAVDNGYVGFCLTVDVALYSRRERDIIKRYTPLGRARGESDAWRYQAGLNWDLVKWFKDNFDIPLQIKGIATAEDAAKAVNHGVEVVYVSNHGGRQLDHGRASIDVLPEIVKAVDGRASVVVDGGFVRGTDVVKAIIRGADAVAIGKVQGFGLAAAGAEGIVRVLELLETEINIVLGLLGVTSYDELDASFLHEAPPVHEAHATSGFPYFTAPDMEY